VPGDGGLAGLGHEPRDACDVAVVVLGIRPQRLVAADVQVRTGVRAASSVRTSARKAYVASSRIFSDEKPTPMPS
jgi:hypothetical protein